MKLLVKNTIIKIKKSLGRFLSILFIIALGISVFIGLRESTAGMLYTADNYYDTYKLMDYKIISTYGLTKEDITSLENLDDSYLVVPTYSVDVLDEGEAIRLHAITNNINKVVLKSGKMPVKDTECLADSHEYKIGNVINFSKEDLKDYINIKSCTVVGTINSPLYIRSEKGISSIGNGKLTSFVYVKEEVFNMDYYTEAYIIAKDTLDKNSYYSSYENAVNKLRVELEELKPIRETIRYEEILKAASKKISEGEVKLYGELAKTEKNLQLTKEELDSNYESLINSKNTLNSSLEALNKEEIASEKTFDEQFTSLGVTKENIESKINEINNEITSLQNSLANYEEGSLEYIEKENDIASLTIMLNNLNDLNTGYNNFKTEIENNRTTIEENLSNVESGLDEIESSYSFYYDGLNTYEEEKLSALNEIAKAKEELNDIEKPVWYLLDREDNSGYIIYKEDVIKIEAISKALPIFFVAIAMLVCLNSLSRLIEEERMEMGILESTGYGRLSIIYGYMLYVFIASILGIGVGLTIGYSIIPKIIYGAFLSRYYVPKLITVISPLPFSLVIVVTLLLMTLVVIIACYKELKEMPSTLLRPKAPKSGKKVFLEKIPLIWNKLSFTWKVTIRNLFRYKKRIIMTILGIAGCTALLLTGLGLNDSINNIPKLQFGKIINYDAMFILDKTQTELGDDLTTLFSKNNVENPVLINQQAYKFSYDNKTSDAYLIYSDSDENLESYVSFYSSLTNKIIAIPSFGALITKQMAEELNVTNGDTIEIRNSNNELFIVYVSDVVENYIANYIYMSKDYYQSIFNEDLEYNMVIAKLNEKPSSNVSLTEHNILSVSYTEDILNSFNSFINGLNKIIYLIVACACMLALIVLYNLTIINISERKREVATLKVLGFNDQEISNYIYRETIILTILGIGIGLILGIFLHRFVMYTAQTDNILFIKTIKWYSYIISAITTIIFSFIVQLIISKTLKKIDMIESLKSVE